MAGWQRLAARWWVEGAGGLVDARHVLTDPWLNVVSIATTMVVVVVVLVVAMVVWYRRRRERVARAAVLRARTRDAQALLTDGRFAELPQRRLGRGGGHAARVHRRL
ncbi:hypothetical protein [Amycolatopsis sp. GM8]|uniref:hypothetical protein n=1 Tax=Amycolatopsis sp. GM8 TaxID=2896530 RepID=UPI001F37B95B|nr:hypothetical protein [Amycolatopsis sp. GM8]